MTIRNLDKYIAQLWDWGFLDKCFQRGIKVTDIDGLVEAGKGQFLIIEAKSLNAPIPPGQHMALKALARTGLFTILIIWGERNKPEKYCLLDNTQMEVKIKTCDETEIQFLVSTWFEQVEKDQK